MYDDCKYKNIETVDRYGRVSSYCYDWPIGTMNFDVELLPESTRYFLRGKLVDIKVLPTIITPQRLFDYPESTYSKEYKTRKTREILDIWGDYNYYLIIVPDSNYVYSVGPECNRVLGCNLIDTLFVPYFSNLINLFYTDKQMDSLEIVHDEKLRLAWAKENERIEKRYKTAVRLFGKAIADVVCEGEVQLGFTTEMCSFAYAGEPYHESYETIPMGTFLCHDYYKSGVKLYFKNDRLVLIRWIDSY
jgi:hypothetical protein